MSKTRVTPDEFMSLVVKTLGVNEFTRADAKAITSRYGITMPSGTCSPDNKIARGVFSAPGRNIVDVEHLEVRASAIPNTTIAPQRKSSVVAPTAAPEVESAPAPALTPVAEGVKSNTVVYEAGHFIPRKNPFYVKWGTMHDDIQKAISKKIFYPVYVTGLTGNGKTMTCLQSGVDIHREIIRVNITAETDEDDLLGGFRLVNGDTVWEDGPVILAMKRGAVLLLDEIDLGTDRIMCLQSVLEGNGVYLKKINKFVYPEDGFNVIATGNTKGKGDDGSYAHTNIMNEAMLDRFEITIDHVYPDFKTEQKILKTAFKVITGETPKEDDKDFINRICKTADYVRTCYFDNLSSDIISTRRLVGMLKSYVIFDKDRTKAVTYATNRFEQGGSILDFYMTLDARAQEEKAQAEASQNQNGDPDTPF